jgi:hypothetical protein
MHRRIEIDCARWQWYADADVDAAAAIVAPTNITTRQRLMIALLFYE